MPRGSKKSCNGSTSKLFFMLELNTGMIVAIAAVALVLEPLVRRSAARPPAAPEEEPVDLEESQSPKIQALLALREIEFDRATGKLSDEDYTRLKEQYSHAALEAMNAEERQSAVKTADDTAEADAAIQRMRKRRRDCPECGIRPEPSAAFCSRCGRSLTETSSRARCWTCGTDLEPDGRYCIGCGAQVAGATTSPDALRNTG
jgi:hypothetical protein